MRHTRAVDCIQSCRRSITLPKSVLLDSLRVGPEDLRRDNAAALLAGLENPSRETYAGLLAALHQRLRAPELRELRKFMLLWAGGRARLV